MSRTPSDPLPRILSRVVVEPGGCHIVTGYASHDGYARASWFEGSRKRGGYAHRYVYERLVGPVPEGMDLGHICHDEDVTCPGGRACAHRRCVNVQHLRPQSRRENLLSGKTLPGSYASRSTCGRGHAYVSGSYRLRGGTRECRECERIREGRTTPA